MDPGDVIAGYAAVVATGAVVVQLFRWRAAQTRVVVKMKPGEAPLATGVGEAMFVTVINRSAHAVKLMGLYFETADGRTFAVLHPFPTGQSFPYSIPGRDQMVFWAQRDGFGDEPRLLDPVRAAVWTATDETFRSKRQPIDDQPRWEVVP